MSGMNFMQTIDYFVRPQHCSDQCLFQAYIYIYIFPPPKKKKNLQSPQVAAKLFALNLCFQPGQ